MCDFLVAECNGDLLVLLCVFCTHNW